MQDKQKHYFHLVAAEVMFSDPENNNAIGSMKINTMIKTPDNLVRAKMIGQAQQAAQLSMFKKLGDVPLQVVDVFILSISNLGRMTDKYFSDMGDVSETAMLEPVQEKTVFDS